MENISEYFFVIVFIKFLQTRLFTTILLVTGIIAAGCSTVHTNTVWKNEHAFPGKYNKIMISAIVDAADTALRSEVENNFKEALLAKGYYAVSSLKEFGVAGLRDLGQEDTYRILCDKGIDAVMTLAIVDRSIENNTEPVSSYTKPVQFYYKRIWDYKERQPEFTSSFHDSSKKYSWEMILFELSTLQPHSIIQSRVYTGGIEQSIQRQFWKDIIKRLTKDRFLEKKRTPVIEGPKAF